MITGKSRMHGFFGHGMMIIEERLYWQYLLRGVSAMKINMSLRKLLVLYAGMYVGYGVVGYCEL